MDNETRNKIKNIQERVPKRKLTKKVRKKEYNPITGKKEIKEHEVVDKKNLKKAEQDMERAMQSAFDSGELDRKKARKQYEEFMRSRK